jgi:GT2 family glycosyltransferase
MVELSIILVNFNTAAQTINCIDSIIKQTKKINHEIIVVDNASSDNSFDLITTKFQQIIWIQNKTNEGFGRANNIGIQKSRGRYILLLNSDTIIFDKAIEKALGKYKNEKSNVGLTSCHLVNLDGTSQKSVFFYNASFREILNNNLLFDFFIRKIKSSREKEIKALHGAFLLFEKSRLESVGYFDPDFFLYAEEFEWCYRIRKSGLALKYYDDIKVLHLEEGSSISKDWNTKQRYLSGSLLFKKTHGTLGLFLYLALHFVNLVTNALLMWKLDSAYRSDFIRSQKYFWGLSGKFLTIAFNTFKKPLILTHIK